MKRWVALLLPLCLLAGCWDRYEINEMAIIIGAALDKKDEEEIELTVQIVVPQALAMGQQGMGEPDGPGGQSTFIVSASGTTVFDAAAKVQEHLPRRLFWGHNRILVIGEALAKEPFIHHIDIFVRHPQPRLRTKMFISKGKGKDILTVIPPLDNTSAKAAQELTRLRFGLQVTMMDFLRMVHSKSQAAVLPWLTVAAPDPEVGDAQPEHLWLNGSAIIQNGQMVGRIDDETTRGLLWILNEIEQAEVTFEPSFAEGHISVQIIRSRTRLIPEIENGTWRMLILVDTYDDIVENQSNLDLDDPRIIDDLEKDLEEKITQRIRQAVQKIQKEMKADCFGFANVFHRHFPEQWRQVKDRWETMFPDVEIELAINAKIKRYGLATHSQGTPKDEVEHR